MAALLALFSTFIYHGSSDDEEDNEVALALLREFFEALKQNRPDVVASYLDKGVNMNANLPNDRKNRNAVIYACEKGFLEIVKLLVDRGAKMTSTGGMSAMDAAAKKGRIEILKYLIEEKNMEVEPKGSYMSPLHFACAYTQLEAAKYLVSKGANIRRTTSQGGTIFSLACSGRNRSMMQWLLSLDVDVNTPDRYRTAPIHIMAKHGPLDLLKMFVESGKVDITVLDGAGRSAVDIADAHLMHEAALYLWERGVERKVAKTLSLALRNTRCVLKGPAQTACATVPNTSKIVGIRFEDAESASVSMLDLDDVKLEPLFPVSEWKSEMDDAKLDPNACGNWIKILDDGLSFVSDYSSSFGDWEPCLVRANKPIPKSQRVGYFEIEIVSIGERNIVTIGLTEEDTNLNHMQPGWSPRTYGFHGDDGAFFDGNGSGVPFASRWVPGDIIGCGVDYKTGAVFFSRNGEFLGAPACTAAKRNNLYPTVGLENAGVEVRVNFGGSGPFRFNFEAPTIAWEPVATEVSEIKAESRNVRLYAHNGQLAVCHDSETQLFDFDFSNKKQLQLKYVQTCPYSIWQGENPPPHFRTTTMDSEGNFWYIYETYAEFGMHISLNSEKTKRGFQAVYRVKRARKYQDRPSASDTMEFLRRDDSDPSDDENVDNVSINTDFVLGLSLDARSNLEALANELRSQFDSPCSIGPHPSLSGHIVLLTRKNRCVTISFPTFAFRILTLKGESVPTGCRLVPVGDRCLACVGGNPVAMRKDADVVSLIDVISGQTFTPEIVSDTLTAIEGCLALAPIVSNPILTGVESSFSGNSAKFPCLVEFNDFLPGYDISIPVAVTQSNGDELEALLRSNPGELSDVEVQFSDDSTLKVHRSVLWSRCSSLREHAENLSQTRIRLDGNSRFSQALVKYCYTNTIDLELVGDDSRKFIDFVQQMAPEHRQNILELLLLTKPVTSSRIGQDLNQLVNNNLFSDIHLTVDGQKLAAHKCILIARSAYFSALFLGGLKESRMQEIPFSGVSFRSLEMIVRYLYTQELDPIFAAASEEDGGAIVPELFSLACQYGIRKLRRDLENILVYNVSSENVSSLLILADRHDSQPLRNRCKKLFEQDLHSIQSSEDYIRNKEELETMLKK